MSHIDLITAPQRAEIIILKDGTPSLRFIKFLESLQTNNNDVSSSIGFTYVESTGSYTTTGTSVIMCATATTITLNGSPEDGEKVTINRTNGIVTVNGGLKLINGESSIILSRDGTSLDFFYNTVLDGWYIV